VDELEHRDPQDGAVHRGHALDLPVPRVGADQLVDLVEVVAHARHQLGGEGLGRHRQLVEHRRRDHALGLGLVQQRDGPLAGLTTAPDPARVGPVAPPTSPAHVMPSGGFAPGRAAPLAGSLMRG